MSGPSRELSFGRRILAWWLARLARLLSWTWFLRRLDPDLGPDSPGLGSAVYAFWHGEQLIMIPLHAHRGVLGMASKSRDGALLAQVIQDLGYGVVRGSSSSGGSEALASCVAALRDGTSVGIAIDGPRGPRHQPHAGAVVMAARAQRPIVCVVAQAWPSWRLGSWDRFQIPLPLARVRIAYQELPPPRDEPEAIEAAREQLQACMRSLSERLRPER